MNQQVFILTQRVSTNFLSDVKFLKINDRLIKLPDTRNRIN